MGHTSRLPVGGQPGEEGRGGREEKTMPLREVGGAQTYARQAKLRTTLTHMTPR